MREVRCGNCGALNRVRSYSVRQIPNCGSCHSPLPETGTVAGLRDVYRWRWPLAGLAFLAIPVLIVTWMEVNQNARSPTATASAPACSGEQPRPGVFRWYGPQWGRDIAQLTISTPVGSAFFIKLVDEAGQTARSYFMRGGTQMTYSVPLGTYKLRYASGPVWCGEDHLFGDDTATTEAADTFRFDDNTHWTVELILQPHGNLRTHAIPRSQF